MKTTTQTRAILGIGTALILAFWLSRLIGVDSFPPFIDEMLHVHVAESAAEQSPFFQADLGRLLTIWWQMLFRSYAAAPIWVARMATVVAVLPGLAALIGLGRLASGLWGGVFAGLFTLFSSYHLFYERLALADPLSGAALALALYFAYRLSRRAALKDAGATGVALFLAFGMKVTALPYFGIPLAAALALRPKGRSWAKQARWLIAALGVAAGLSGIMVVGLRLRGYDLLTNSLSLALSNRAETRVEDVLSVTRIAGNIARTFDVLVGYVGPVAAVLLVAAVIVLVVRRRFYLPLCFAAPLVLVWLSQPQTSRYLFVPLTILLLCGAVVLADAIRARRREIQLAALALVVLWGLVQWLPFAWNAARDPAAIPFPAGDYAEYVRSDASGFGFAEVRGVLRQFEVREVIGALSHCQGFRYFSWRDFPVTCPQIRPDGQDVRAIADLMDERRAEGVYVVLEDSPYVPDTAPGRLVTVIEHPGGRPALSIYDLAP